MTDDEFIKTMKALGPEDSALMAVKLFALSQNNSKLNAGLDDYARLPKRNKEDASCEIDYDLLSRLKSICGEAEAPYWGRLICKCAMRGDERRVEAIQGLMRCRVAN